MQLQTLQDLLQNAQIQELQENLAGTIAGLVILGAVAIIWLAALTPCVLSGDDSREIANLKQRVAAAEERLDEFADVQQLSPLAQERDGQLAGRIYQLEERMTDIEQFEPIATAPTTVRSVMEEGIHEMASIEKWREELVAVHGQLPAEMEDLFAEYRKQVKYRRLAELEREMTAMMGMEAVR